MRNEWTPENLHELLVIWHRYESQWTPVEGYPSECPSTAGYRASRQYDSHNGAEETDQRGKLAAHVGQVVDGMPEPHRTAIRLIARNKATGATVWTSARLPADKDELLRIAAAAMEIFAARV